MNSVASSAALRVLREKFGHNQFRYPQSEVIQRTLAGGHSMVILPTGGGKSVCFQIPAILLGQDHDSMERAMNDVRSPWCSRH